MGNPGHPEEALRRGQTHEASLGEGRFRLLRHVRRTSQQDRGVGRDRQTTNLARIVLVSGTEERRLVQVDVRAAGTNEEPAIAGPGRRGRPMGEQAGRVFAIRLPQLGGIWNGSPGP